MVTIENEKVKISVKPLGAELCSIYNKETRLEYMWQAGPEWPKHSPVLFPVVGQLKDNQYIYNNKKFELPRHGFAREKNFSLIEHGPNRLVFRLCNDQETMQCYPFQFNFEVEYALRDNVVVICFVAENTGKENMLFSLGAHPAFKIPLMENEKYEDYKLIFDCPVNAETWELKSGLLSDETKQLINEQPELPLKKSLFENDALVFKNFEASSISIASKNHNHGITVELNDAPYLGLWAAKKADFICIEPWYGIADSINSNGELSSKEGMISLVPADEFSYSYSIKVY